MEGLLVRSPFFIFSFWKGNVGKRIFLFLSGGDTQNMIGETAARCLSRYPHSSLGYKRGKRKKDGERKKNKKEKINQHVLLLFLLFPTPIKK
jgi:hypothetical protein